MNYCCNFVEHILFFYMKKSQLVNILKTFSSKDIREMRKWLLSPAHNQRQDVVQLFEYFFEDHHLEKEEFLEKPTVFSWIFPKETYDDARMRQVMYFLLKSIEEFLTFQELGNDTIHNEIALAKVFRRRKLDKLYHKTLKKLKSEQTEYDLKNHIFFKNGFLIEEEEYAFLRNTKRAEFNLQEVSDSFDIYFITTKLRQIILMAAHQNVYKTDYEIGFLDEILEKAQMEKYIQIPAVAIYFYGYKTITEKENESHFQKLKAQINDHGHTFPLFEIRDIYLMAINYCIGRMNTGAESFVREAFELYKVGFEKKILIENNLVTRVTFHNVISIGLVLKEYVWVKSFINIYQQYLQEKHREGFVYYSLARVHYKEKNYDQAMKLLVQDVHYDDIIINLSAKLILLKMYYELQEFDALESLLESMRTYIQRKKVLGYHKNNYKNIIRFTKKLLKVTPYSSTKKEKLKLELETATPLTEKEWLLEQLSNV